MVTSQKLVVDWIISFFDVVVMQSIEESMELVICFITCSMAKFVVDAEQCAMGYRMAEGIRWDDFDAALQAVRDVGPGGHYLGHPHTLENFQRAFFMPEMFDNNSIEQWQAEGSIEINERALQRVKDLLNEYEEPKLDEGTNEALLDYIARREREIPAAEALNQDH